MPEKKAPPKKPLYYYYILALAIILLINTVIVPTFFSPQVKEISYGNFLQMVDDGKVAKVEITNNDILRIGPAFYALYGQQAGWWQCHEFWQE